ncbi:ribbon-helix-helix domain-containing protein [Enterococcus cecorum]|uniref:ribbon-helix-helix domain-containing protein n=1 Tax=Enterococcus cecorum TaxID=44008 RepID=UPI00148B3B0A|nr:ribbon-helix-helix domain-containing protein [Enterococcus cecorum]
MAISLEKKRVAITMNDKSYEILSELSEKLGISKSAVIAMLLANEKTKQTSKRK